jgi:4-alpha-glucanotransferase
VPGAELLRKIIRTVGKDRVIAEDLGLVVPGVLKLRDQFDIPGMRVFQFGFGNDGDSGYHMPYQCPSHSVAYTGTHDNDTLVGWFSMARDQSSSPKPSFDFAKMQVVVGNDSMNVHWHGIKAVAMSPAKLAIFQMQDALGLGTDARMNVPGVANGNWGWRLKSVPGGDLAQQLHGIARATDRIPQRPKSSHRKG